MPLVIFTGLPSSGKSRWAQQLADGLQQRIDAARAEKQPGHNYKVIVHSDELLDIKHDMYRELATEKHARGTQMLAVKRDLARTTLVVLDSLSYIKGFRYQLFCEAKGIATPHCVVHVVCPPAQCLEWNQKSQNPWDPELMDQLAMRYEEPQASARWDLPLFTLDSSNPNETLPLDEMWDALVLKRAPPPNTATVLKPTLGNDYLQELDRLTLEVVSKVLQFLQVHTYGSVPIGPGTAVELEQPVSTAQLQRVRRSFIALNRMRSVDPGRIQPLFVEYLNKSLAE